LTFRDQHTVGSAGAAAGRGAAHQPSVAINGLVSLIEPDGPRLVALMNAHSAVKELMTLRGSSGGLQVPDGPPWPDLFDAFEIVRASVGGEGGLEALGFPKERIGLFKRTAQQYRHARPTGSPPRFRCPRPRASISSGRSPPGSRKRVNDLQALSPGG
jgi:hypothetical protein